MMIVSLLLAASPALADSAQRAAKEWSSSVVSDLAQWNAEVAGFQEQADEQRDLSASRCLAPLAGDLRRMERQGQQIADRYLAATKDDSSYAQAVAQQELGTLHYQASNTYSRAWSCGSFDPGRSGVQWSGLGGVGGTARDLYWRAEDGMYVGPAHLTAGLYSEAGYNTNPLQLGDGSDGSMWWALTPRVGLSSSGPRGSYLSMSGQARLSRYPGASERNETGTWQARADFYRQDHGLGGGLSAATAREVSLVTPWPDVPGVYAHSEHVVAATVSHIGGRHLVQLQGGLSQESWLGSGLDRQRQSLPLTLDMVVGGAWEGLMVQAEGERINWTGDGAPMGSGNLASIEGGLRVNRLESHYGVGWIQNLDTGELERSWVGGTWLEIPVRSLTLLGFHQRRFTDHWLAPTAITHTAGGEAWVWWRGFNPHVRGSWGVEQPGQLRMRTVQGEAGLRYAPVEGLALDLSGSWTQREQVSGPSVGELDFDETRVLLTLEIF